MDRSVNVVYPDLLLTEMTYTFMNQKIHDNLFDMSVQMVSCS